ncbi:MAG: B12-binding domain-containing radical SAM protein [bacterium]
MRALLINPWIYDFKAFDFWNKPLGLLIVADILKKCGFEIDFVDCLDRLSPYFKTETKTDIYGRGKYHYELVDKPQIYKDIPRRYKRYGMPRNIFCEQIRLLKVPDLILVTSSMTYWYLGVIETIRILKQNFSTTPVVLGGLYATLCKEHAEKNSGADFVIDGAAEVCLINFLKEQGFLNKPLKTTESFPDFSLYDKINYGVVTTSRGCPFKCTYCATRVLIPDFYYYDVKLILKQIQFFADKTTDIAFFDDALLCNPKFPEILEKIIAKNFRINLHSSNGLHCRLIDKGIARLMYRANFKTMYLSLETTNPVVQKDTGNKVNTDEFLNAVEILKEAGFSTDQIHVYLLYGMPGQSIEEIVEGIKLCHSLGVHPHLCEFSPIPHTEEFNKSKLSVDTDPLYHNNHFYTWYYPEPKYGIYRKIKSLLTQNRT